ncbi:acyltransferase family protein [Sphingomonas sp. PB2P19]|uniref:acyltransferase family protein n=1 Tax=Sphingomonas rhamnosi TaxID=3096156 RepID=UPI002FC9DDF3
MNNGNDGTSSRLHYLDALRAFVMTLGVVLHASVIGHFWFSRGVGYFSGLFRMKLFMLIAGFFVALLISRRGINATLRERLIRFGVPAVAGTILLNPIADYFLYGTAVDFISPNAFFSNNLQWNKAGFEWGKIAPPYMSWHLQLWFLYVAVILIAGTPLFLRLIDLAIVKRAATAIFYSPKGDVRAGMLGLFMGLAFAGGRVAHFVTTQQAGVDSPLNYLAMNTWLYLPYFILGLVAFRNEKIMEALHTVSLPWIALSFGALAASHVAYKPVLQLAGLGPAELVEYLGKGFAGYFVCVILLATFRKVANKPRTFADYLSKVSYSVYIFHVLMISIVQYILVSTGYDRISTYWLSIPLAYAACIVAHTVLVASNPVGDFLFNGKIPASKIVASRAAETASTV